MPSFQHGPLHIASLVTGPVQENTVLVWGPDGQGFLIDPGDEAGRVLAWVRELGVQVQAVVLTHAHFDHIGAVQPVREALGVPVYAHPDGLPLYRQAGASAQRWNLPFTQPADPDHELRAGDVLRAGSLSLEARDLPGHAPGHLVLLARAGDGETEAGGPEDSGAVQFAVVGDTLFQGSVGRTDLPGGDHPQLIEGIGRELLTLPDDTTLYPGHGARTTVGRERTTNPFLR